MKGFAQGHNGNISRSLDKILSNAVILSTFISAVLEDNLTVYFSDWHVIRFMF